jgi:hypothetical protein
VAKPKRKHNPATKKIGRPPFQPTDEQRKIVSMCAAVGITQEDIARIIVTGGIDADTLAKHFREELDVAATKANAQVGGMLYNKALSGDVTAGIWWTKTRMRWREAPQEMELKGAGGGLMWIFPKAPSSTE